MNTRFAHKVLPLLIIMITALSLAACGGDGSGNEQPPPPQDVTGISRTAVFSGDQAVPPVSTAAAASGVLIVNTDTGAAGGSMTITTQPATAVIAAHVHEGARGTNGSICITMKNSVGGVWSVPSDKALSPGQVGSFLAGNLYFNVRTKANPNGELRGQIDQ